MFDDIKISEPRFLRNLVLIPVGNGNSTGPFLSSIDEVLTSKKGRFQELTTPDVNIILFENNSANPLLVIDGEEITGSLQNRIVTRSTIIEARTKKELPVICVEEGRWDNIGGFHTGSCSYPRIRSILSRSIKPNTSSLKKAQELIWSEVTRKLMATRTNSTTSSMHDIYENLSDELSRYTEGFSKLNRSTIGFIGIAGGRILGCDLFGSHRIYKKFEDKLVRAYALDAIEYQHLKSSIPPVEQFLKRVLDTFKREIANKNKKGVMTIKGKEFSGQGLIYQDFPAHLSVFPLV